MRAYFPVRTQHHNQLVQKYHSIVYTKSNISKATNTMGSRVTVRLEESLTSFPQHLQSQIRIITEECVHACNASNGRLKDSNFDVTYIDFLSRYFTWLEVNKDVQHYLTSTI